MAERILFALRAFIIGVAIMLVMGYISILTYETISTFIIAIPLTIMAIGWLYATVYPILLIANLVEKRTQKRWYRWFVW